MQGDQRLDTLGEQVVSRSRSYLDAQVGAVYVAEADGSFRRVAGYALPAGHGRRACCAGRRSASARRPRTNRSLHVTRRAATATCRSLRALGRGKPRELLIAPGSVDGVVQAVVELGFFRARATPPSSELLARVSESLGVAVRASKDRTRLEELLEETQRQAEELQTQQEELRVTNEELEEQGRALQRVAGARSRTQQAELEQTNTQLEEQTQLLEQQKDELAEAQAALTEQGRRAASARTSTRASSWPT